MAENGETPAEERDINALSCKTKSLACYGGYGMFDVTARFSV